MQTTQYASLLDQQIWLFGRDIEYGKKVATELGCKLPATNLMLQYGFTVFKENDKSGRMYVLQRNNCRCVVWAFGVLCSSRSKGSIYISRDKNRLLPKYRKNYFSSKGIFMPDQIIGFECPNNIFEKTGVLKVGRKGRKLKPIRFVTIGK